jgi:hypothetical protein
MSPEISTTNKVRYRVGVAEKAWREALELVREAAAVPGYSGPALEEVERVGAAIAQVRGQVRNWTLDEPRQPPARGYTRPEPYHP